jgi:hypothetical protein
MALYILLFVGILLFRASDQFHANGAPCSPVSR